MNTTTKVTLALVALLGMGAVAGQSGIEAGKAALDEGQYELAVRRLSEALHEQPNSERGHYLLGVAYEKLDRDSQALVEFEAALALKPQDGDISYALAYVYWKLKRWPKAAFYASSALVESGNNDVKLRTFAGWLHILAGDYSEGEGLLSGSADGVNDMDLAILLARARIELGRPREALGAVGEALHAKVGGDPPTATEVMPSYVRWLLTQDCPSSWAPMLESEPMLFKTWSVLEPASDRPSVWEAILLLKRNDPERAAALLQPVVKRSPESCAPRYYLTLSLQFAGKDPKIADALRVCSHVGGSGAIGESEFMSLDTTTLKPMSMSMADHLRMMGDRSRAAGREGS